MGFDDRAIAMSATLVSLSAARKGSDPPVDYLPARNRLLAALRDADPAAEAQLRAGLESVELKGHAKVMRPDRPIRHVYFPETGVLSVLQQMRNGSSVAVNLVGSDGMVGLGVYLGAAHLSHGGDLPGAGDLPAHGRCGVPGRGRPECAAAQGPARVHPGRPGDPRPDHRLRALPPVEARAARWLLEMDDRVAQDEFTMTHEFLALMLGVRRQTVSAVVSDLSRRGLVVYRRGFIEIVDRAGLEDATCECYEFIREEFARLVGPPLPRARKARPAAATP